ncbi:HAMP domain-containing protein [Sphingorhabdus sp. IMCC26285]|uniref:histidine kinase n=1 Tax=Sphingorhabdus profundilacus TaxID=2509718 RepID=A0A6I4LYI5_9SPHN|nr:ATP-binding protein [Sphingorhabdus profundilacus]MVZ96924.1 HAMP domain-containing protein [Sphingorhabdus profundilacus]
MATTPMIEEGNGQSFAKRLLQSTANALGNSQSIKFMEIGSALLLIGVTAATAFILMDQGPQSEPLSPAASATMLVANLLPATLLLVLFGRRIALKRAEGSNIDSQQLLHVRLVAIFSAITAVPTLLLVVFASLLFQSGVQFWFSGSARGMLENAGELAKGYYEVNARDVGDETLTMAGDFRNALSQTNPDDPAFLSYYFEQVFRRRLSESAIVSVQADGIQRTEAVATENTGRTQDWIPPETLAKLQAGEGTVVTNRTDRIEVVTVLFDSPRSYLYASRALSVPSFQLGAKAQSVLRDYDKMVARSRALQLQFNIALYIVSLLIIGITLWIALRVADRLVRPVNNLVEAAQRIAGGDLSARVSEDQYRADEVGFLSQSFNRMTERLERQTGALLATNHQLGERRVFIETVLESVSAGVVSVNEQGEIELANSTAEKMLFGKAQTIVGLKFRDVAPALAELTEDRSRGVVQLGDGPEPLTVAVKATQRERGVVVTFEDISQQLADQRRAAWSDVARRIAHEIKNPLTPIQLAAERLQRRFGKQVENDSGIFEQLTATIIRQVGDLRNIVDEFSSFARMPKPVFRNENLQDIVGHAVFLFEVAHPDISFSYQPIAQSPMLISDRRQLGQAFTNILKNAVESIQERQKSNPIDGKISVEIKESSGHLYIQICDNGIGLPEDRDRIMEPYITNRATGSGLGLAIVKKIVEEHFGEISLQDSPGGGAIITLTFIPQMVAEKVKNAFSPAEQSKLAQDEF